MLFTRLKHLLDLAANGDSNPFKQFKLEKLNYPKIKRIFTTLSFNNGGSE